MSTKQVDKTYVRITYSNLQGGLLANANGL